MDSPLPTPARRLVTVLACAVLGVVGLAGCSSSDSSAAERGGVSAGGIYETTTTVAAPTTTTTPRAVAGSRLPAGANTIYVLGDSVTLGAQVQFPQMLNGWNVTFDAKESRRIDQGAEIVSSKGGAMGRVLVVHLCTNWGNGDYHAAAADLLSRVKGVDRVVWVTCTPWTGNVGAADEVIRALPNEYPNLIVADWAAISATPGYTYDDHLHLRTPGAEALALLVAATVGPAPAAS